MICDDLVSKVGESSAQRIEQLESGILNKSGISFKASKKASNFVDGEVHLNQEVFQKAKSFDDFTKAVSDELGEIVLKQRLLSGSDRIKLLKTKYRIDGVKVRVRGRELIFEPSGSATVNRLAKVASERYSTQLIYNPSMDLLLRKARATAGYSHKQGKIYFSLETIVKPDAIESTTFFHEMRHAALYSLETRQVHSPFQVTIFGDKSAKYLVPYQLGPYAKELSLQELYIKSKELIRILEQASKGEVELAHCSLHMEQLKLLVEFSSSRLKDVKATISQSLYSVHIKPSGAVKLKVDIKNEQWGGHVEMTILEPDVVAPAKQLSGVEGLLKNIFNRSAAKRIRSDLDMALIKELDRSDDAMTFFMENFEPIYNRFLQYSEKGAAHTPKDIRNLQKDFSNLLKMTREAY